MRGARRVQLLAGPPVHGLQLPCPTVRRQAKERSAVPNTSTIVYYRERYIFKREENNPKKVSSFQKSLHAIGINVILAKKGLTCHFVFNKNKHRKQSP